MSVICSVSIPLPEVLAIYERIIAAWNARDAAAFAVEFLEAGHVVGFDGSQLDGAEAIASTLAGIFQQHATPPFVAIVRELALLAPNVALLRAVVGMAPPSKTEVNPDVNAVQSMMAIQIDGAWRVALFQNTPAAFHGRPHLQQQLTQELNAALQSL